MFTGISLSHQSNGRFGMGIQFCNPDGTCRDLTVLNEFMDRLETAGWLRLRARAQGVKDFRRARILA